jgi:prepilin-type N-terminal cleavage/methylation domain-containing protein
MHLILFQIPFCSSDRFMQLPKTTSFLLTNQFKDNTIGKAYWIPISQTGPILNRALRHWRRKHNINRAFYESIGTLIYLNRALSMQRNQKGFTLIEIIVVFLLMSIIAATVLVRSIGTSDLDLARQSHKIRGQIIYAQSTAMKRNEYWGIACNVSSQYWFFRHDEPSGLEIIFPFPGEENGLVSLSEMNISMNSFKVIFNEFGQPFNNDLSTLLTAADNPFITISSGSLTPVTISIEPETGLIQ